jgi:hypothetical protein
LVVPAAASQSSRSGGGSATQQVDVAMKEDKDT